MKYLVVGDPHLRPEDLASGEGDALMGLVLKLALEAQVDRVVFLGDLFHTFSLVHVEVLAFWRRWLARLVAEMRPRAQKVIHQSVFVLRGNHDGPHDPIDGVSALNALQMDGVWVIDTLVDLDGIAWVPYCRDNTKFVAACAIASDRKTVYCHQEFNGCSYDNGFYSSVGVDPEAINQTTVISGHIHDGQEFGKIWYPGAPRWLTASDVNKNRFLWVVEHGDDGAVLSRKSYPTDGVCARMVEVNDLETAPTAPESLPANCKVVVNIRGTKAWLEARVALWAGTGARIRTYEDRPTKAVEVRESQGIGTAFRSWRTAYKPRFGADPKALAAMADALNANL